MRANEFLSEATGPDQPPQPGSPDFEKSKEYMAKLTRISVDKYNNYLTTIKTSNPKMFSDLIDNPNKILDGLKKSIKQSFTSVAKNNIKDADIDNIFNSVNLEIPGGTEKSDEPKPDEPKPDETKPDETKPDTAQDRLVQAGELAKLVTKAKAAMAGGPKITKEEYKILSDLQARKGRPPLPASIVEPDENPTESVNESAIVWNKDIPSVQILDADINDIAHAATVAYYQNRLDNYLNVSQSPQSAGTDPLLSLLSRIFKVNPTDKVNLAKNMIDAFEKPDMGKEIANRLRRNINL